MTSVPILARSALLLAISCLTGCGRAAPLTEQGMPDAGRTAEHADLGTDVGATGLDAAIGPAQPDGASSTTPPTSDGGGPVGGPDMGPPAQPLGFLCRFDAPEDASRAVLAVPAGKDLVLVNGDGTHSVGFSFGAGRAVTDDDVVIESVQAKAGRIAASAFIDDAQGGNVNEIVLLDAAGTVLWHDASSNQGSPPIYLGDSGALAVDFGNNRDSAVVAPDGTATRFQAIVVAAPFGTQFVPVGNSSAKGPFNFEWFNVATQETVPLARPYDPDDAGDGVPPTWIAGRLVYRSRQGQALSLVSELPAAAGAAPDVVETPLPAAGDAFGPSVTAQSAAGWLILSDFDSDAKWRLRLTTGEIAPVQIVSPTGMQPAQNQTSVIEIDDEGALLASFVGDTASGVFRSTDIGGSWTQIGRSVDREADSQGPLGIFAAGSTRGGTYLVSTVDTRSKLVVAGATQLIRPGAPVGPDAPAQPELSPDGICGAFWDAQMPNDLFGPAALKVVDVARQITTPILPAQPGRQPVVWVP